MRACVPSSLHSFSRIRGATYLGIYLTSNRPSTAVGSRLSDFPKTEGVEGITSLRTANGVKIPTREGRRWIYPVDGIV